MQLGVPWHKGIVSCLLLHIKTLISLQGSSSSNFSANVFYKANSKLAVGLKQAGMAVGAKVPCVLSSRGDSIDTKLNSIAIAAMACK